MLARHGRQSSVPRSQSMKTGYSCFFLTSLEAARPCVLGLAHGRGRAGDQSCGGRPQRPRGSGRHQSTLGTRPPPGGPPPRAPLAAERTAVRSSSASRFTAASSARACPRRAFRAAAHPLADIEARGGGTGGCARSWAPAASSASRWTAPTGCCGWAWADSGSKYQLQQLVGHCESLTFWPHLTD